MKRIILSLMLIATLGNLFAQSIVLNTKVSEMSFYSLPYAYEALEPTIDKLTVEIHYSKHHKAYFDNFLKASTGTDITSKSLLEVFANMTKYSDAIRNNAGGYYNHVIYWEILKPGNKSNISVELKNAIEKDFGSMDELKKQITDAAMKRFGSGWAWLSINADGKLFISSTPNQDNPLMDLSSQKGFPILGVDVWEHAYYLKYQNRRAEYVNIFWDAINWAVVSEYYSKSRTN